MFKVDAGWYAALFEQYKSEKYFFPLIGAVLLQEQDGVVYVDNLANPKQSYIEHSFGFAQVIGEERVEFENSLERHLLVERRFSAPKVRLYGTYLPRFLRASTDDKMCSLRQRFRIEPEARLRINENREKHNQDLRATIVDRQNVAEIDRVFQVVHRFWRNADDFVEKANAVAVYYREQLAGICYSAAEADHRVEIDVFTVPEFRKLGVGKMAVTQYLENCLSQSLEPLWDCFTNNSGSMNLGRSAGFSAAGNPYPFFTINK